MQTKSTNIQDSIITIFLVKIQINLVHFKFVNGDMVLFSTSQQKYPKELWVESSISPTQHQKPTNKISPKFTQKLIQSFLVGSFGSTISFI